MFKYVHAGPVVVTERRREGRSAVRCAVGDDGDGCARCACIIM